MAPAVARRTPLKLEQVRRGIGGLFLVLTVLYLVKASRDLARR